MSTNLTSGRCLESVHLKDEGFGVSKSSHIPVMPCWVSHLDFSQSQFFFCIRGWWSWGWWWWWWWWLSLGRTDNGFKWSNTHGSLAIESWGACQGSHLIQKQVLLRDTEAVSPKAIQTKDVRKLGQTVFMNRWRHGRNARSIHPNNNETGMLCRFGKKENWGKQAGRNRLWNCQQAQRRELRKRQAFIYDFWCRYSCLFLPGMHLALTFLWIPQPSLSSTGKNWSLTVPPDGEICDLGSLLYWFTLLTYTVLTVLGLCHLWSPCFSSFH